MNERLNVYEAAAYLKVVGPRTLNNYRVTGKGPVYLKVGRRVVYRKADLDAWLAANGELRQSTTVPVQEAA